MAMIGMNRFAALDAEFENLTHGKAAEKPKEAKAAASPVAINASASVCPDDIKCSRCGRVGHYAKDCKLPFARNFTRAEMHMKQEAWKAKQAAEADKPAKKEARVVHEWDAKSDISLASTAVSAASTLTYEQELEVHASVAKDKEVRRLEKLLREIAKLEQSTDLNALQQRKANRKSALELDLETARGLAAARARNQVRQQSAHLDKMD